MMAIPQRIPPELQHIKAFIRHAEELEENDQDCPETRIIAHYCRIHAAQEGMPYATSDEGKQYLSELLDQVESEMEAVSIITREESHVLCRNYAERIFNDADAEDKKGNVGKKAAEMFEAAATFYEILPQFYGGDEDEERNGEDQKEEEVRLEYCRRRAMEILEEMEERARLESTVSEKVSVADASVSSLSLSDAGLREHEECSLENKDNSRDSGPSCPPELDAVKPFVQRAQELDNDDSDSPESQIVAHYCRLHAVNVGMTYATSEEGKDYIAHLLSLLEEEEGNISIITRDESHVLCKNHADHIFDSADARDKIFASAGKETAEMFENAAIFYEILEQFHDADIEEDQKEENQKEEELKKEYCRTRAREIRENIIEGSAKVEPNLPSQEGDFFSQQLAKCKVEALEGNEEKETLEPDSVTDEKMFSEHQKGYTDEVHSALPTVPTPFDQVEPGNDVPQSKDANEEDDDNDDNKIIATSRDLTEESSTGEVVHIIDQLDDEVHAMEDFNQSMVSVMDEEAMGNMIHFTDEEAKFWSEMGFAVQEASIADSVDENSPTVSPHIKPKLLRPSILRAVSRSTSHTGIMDSEASVDPKARDSLGLPLGGEYFKATLPDGHFGAIFFRASEMRNYLYCSAPRHFIKTLKNRPIVAYTSSDSVIDSAGICLGDVILKVQDDAVDDPKSAMYLVHELRNRKSSFSGIELYVWRPPPSIDVMPSENQCMVEYHSRNIDVPSASKGWKAKYVVVGGIVSKPHIINMYYNKKDYDTAVAESLSRKRKVSVKVKSWSLNGARLITPKLNFVHYANEKQPWYYFVLTTSKGKSIKIAHPIIDGIKPLLDGVKRALKTANYGNFVEE